MWRGKAFYASFVKRTAYIQAPHHPGTRIVAVDLRTGDTRDRGTVRVWGFHQLTPNASGTLLAGDSSTEGGFNSRLAVADLTRRPIRARTIPLPAECCGFARWLDNDRFAYFSGTRILLYTATLQPVGKVSGWIAGEAALLGRTAYGVNLRGALVRAQLPSGPVQIVRRLPGKPEVVSAAR